MSDDDRRAALKAAGWRRSDRAGLGERWYRDDGKDEALGVLLATAWRSHTRGTR